MLSAGARDRTRGRRKRKGGREGRWEDLSLSLRGTSGTAALDESLNCVFFLAHTEKEAKASFSGCRFDKVPSAGL